MSKRLYTKKNWYISNYSSLGSEWLINALEQLNLKNGYCLYNFSANAGFYERDAYLRHKEQLNPKYFVGDLYASELKDEKVESFDLFTYMSGDNDASDVDMERFTDKADVIIDCKGALWYSLESKAVLYKLAYRGCKNKIISILENYRKLLADEKGVLLIDEYRYTYLQLVCNYVKWNLLKGMNRKCISDAQEFCEISSFQALEKVIGKRRLHKYSKKIVPLKTGNVLATKMGMAYFDRNDLDKLIEYINKMPQMVFWIRMAPFRHITCILLYMATIGCIAITSWYYWLLAQYNAMIK